MDSLNIFLLKQGFLPLSEGKQKVYLTGDLMIYVNFGPPLSVITDSDHVVIYDIKGCPWLSRKQYMRDEFNSLCSRVQEYSVMKSLPRMLKGRELCVIDAYINFRHCFVSVYVTELCLPVNT